jgi:ATP-binding cassette subfamily B protein
MDFRAFWHQMKTIGLDILSINKKKSSAVLICRSASSIFPLVQIYLIKLLIDELMIRGNTYHHLIYILIAFAAIQWISSIINQFSGLWETVLQQEVTDVFSNRIIDKTTHLDYSLLENPSFQNSLYLAQQQARFRVNQLLPAMYNSFSSGLSIFFLIILFVGIKAYFFLLIVLLAIPITIHKWLEGKKSTDLEFKLSPKERESQYLFQILTGTSWSKEIRTIGFGHQFQEQFKKIRDFIATEKNRIQQAGLSKGLIIESLEISLTIGIMFYLSISAMDAKLGTGLFILYLQGVQRLQSSSKSFFQSLLQLFQLRIFIKDLYAFLALPDSNPIKNKIFKTNIDELKIENLSFGYPGGEGLVLDQINLRAKKGEIIAIVGDNGSGKSTLVKLIARLYQPDKGKILFDQENDDGSSGSFLFQDFQTYQYSVESNIHFSMTPSPTESEAARVAAIHSNADAFIKKLGKGYQTQLGHLHEGSLQLSGGQMQKIALARIFYQKKALVVLDEPSSALDAFSELELYENIRKEFYNSIVILISHRLYNLKLADRIYVMKDGRIVQEGSFDELSRQDGLFKTMYEKQKI